MQEYIRYLQKCYYEGNPVISNEEYDALVSRFGEDGLGVGGEFKHMYRMYSLDKVYPGRGEELPLPVEKCIETPKLDGCAISLFYIGNKLVQGNTRGDGITSPTTFEPWKLALLVPGELSSSSPIQITGEVVTTNPVKNMRNYASGAMQLKDEKEFRERVLEGGLIFVAYGIQEAEDHAGIFPHYEQDMAWLSGEGFCTVVDSDWEDCPQDGRVFRLSSNRDFFDAGFTHKHPKGAFAVKEDEEGIWTKLVDLTWQTGKSGKVTPVAIFEPIFIDDAEITRATLNNAGYVENLGVYEGCEVCVIRSGGIIPKIIDVR
ncbi:NAD-dependent DNA ligase [Vibrio phage vB_VpS_PG07]|uniref:DNA ligase (NAD(+)) n=1 Tax=Vibrio phage vB_VpS_PG07 TaxID=2301664 RepID=A0A385E4L5_9CAUD|nr:NAD-dependent DNA ligase [Vibrio phage vB_VpS_PG07]AXQ66731.1 putative NAD-dependent DNA ligase subunit A [Vibrio phage vB_VpS_PG07]